MTVGLLPERPVISAIDIEPPPVLGSLIKLDSDVGGGTGVGDLGAGIVFGAERGPTFSTVVVLALALSRAS